MPQRPHQPDALRIVRPRPAVLVVQGVPQRVVEALPARRRDVVRPAVLQLAVRRQHVHVRSTVLLAVQHRRPGVLVRLHARPGRLLELLQRPLDLLPRRGVLRRPGDHPGFVRVLELQRVGHRRHLVRVAPQNLDLLALRAQVVALPQQVLGRFRGAAGAVAEELNQHRRSRAAR